MIKIIQHTKPTCIEGSVTILIQVITQNKPPKIGVSGNNGAANFKSLTVLPDLIHCLRKLNWLTQIEIQTTTIVNAATPNKFLKIVSGANNSDNNPGIAPNIVTMIAIIGVPERVNLANTFGNCFLADNDHIIREAANKPEFAADNNAVIITKRIMSSAYGIPI